MFFMDTYYLIIFCMLYMSFIGLYIFSSMRKHILLMLLSLEFLVVILFSFLFLFLYFYGFEGYFLLFFLVFSVCEGVLGLSILVNLIRSHGNDNIITLSSLLW
uniref:NADH-ubiquinone oxidoreductase chain 4L n=1 Tax=Helotrephes sp. NKMT027 TaxID=1320099 RepID=C5HIX4_9HEMI|nr:NADH dehydrogenase subunit 4L [Helotrephes sp. NKMT027]ACJ69569.1 NADH dehydrogenase subunit 4L [Helotrephes sp. NKMT027]